MAKWKVKRWVVEEFEVDADTQEEALRNVENPYSVIVTKETAKRIS